MNTHPKGRVMVVDDEALIAYALADSMETLGLAVCGIAATASDAIRLFEEHQPDLVLMDVRLKGDHDGVYAAQEIHKRRPTPVVFITGSMEQQTVERIRQDHPADILFKPVLPQHLAAAVKKQLS